MTINKKPGFYARKKDKNHNEIADGLRGDGHYVVDTHKQGEGFPDVLVIPSGCQFPCLLEIKMPGEGLTDKEDEFWTQYPGVVFIVHTLEEAREFIDKYSQICRRT